MMTAMHSRKTGWAALGLAAVLAADALTGPFLVAFFADHPRGTSPSAGP